MKTAILAGGVGSRLSEETVLKPKPMVEIGGRPILWHIMMHYRAYGHKDFVIALGYKGEYIKKYFIDYASLEGDLRVDMSESQVQRGDTAPSMATDWTVDLVETGIDTQTGGRIKRLQPYLDEPFFLTWGDGVSNVDLDALLQFHRAHGKMVTVTAARPPARFGHMHFEGDRVVQFTEKPQTAEGWINGAFFVCEPGVFDFIEGEATHFEREPLEGLADAGELMAYKHEGFWQCMDTLRDRVHLQTMWDSGNPAWKTWK